MKNTLQFSAYQYFLADNFADDQKKWELYAKNFALRFLLKYNENLDYMIEKMSGFSDSFDYLTPNETNQLKIISNFISLRGLLKFNNSTKSVEIDYSKIDANFLEIKDAEEIAEMSIAINTLEDDDRVEKPNSFGELNVYFNSLVSFIKYRDVRRTFYLDYLTSDEITVPQRESKSLFLNRKIL